MVRESQSENAANRAKNVKMFSQADSYIRRLCSIMTLLCVYVLLALRAKGSFKWKSCHLRKNSSIYFLIFDIFAFLRSAAACQGSDFLQYISPVERKEQKTYLRSPISRMSNAFLIVLFILLLFLGLPYNLLSIYIVGWINVLHFVRRPIFFTGSETNEYD